MARVLLTEEEKRANANNAVKRWKIKNNEKCRSVSIMSHKTKNLDDLMKSYSTSKLGYKIPIGSLLVAALEYIDPMLKSKELVISRRGGNVQIIKESEQ